MDVTTSHLLYTMEKLLHKYLRKEGICFGSLQRMSAVELPKWRCLWHIQYTVGKFWPLAGMCDYNSTNGRIMCPRKLENNVHVNMWAASSMKRERKTQLSYLVVHLVLFVLWYQFLEILSLLSLLANLHKPEKTVKITFTPIKHIKK